MDFENKVIVISGTGSGIGKACVELLLEKGAMVVGIDIKSSSINHKNYRHYSFDVSDEQKLITAIDDIDEKYGRIEGLVNCAGVFSCLKPFYDISIEEWNKVISTNLTGLFMLSKYTAQKMIKHKDGKIVNISCIRSKIFRPNMADYAATKGGVVALTSAMALDLSPYNIRVNSVAPGFTYTGMTQKSFNIPEVRELSESLIPVGKIADPLDIANVVLFLLSDMAAYITGETIYADGGYKLAK